MKKILISFIILLMALATLTACSMPGGDEPDKKPTTYNVLISDNDGIVVKSQNPLSVEKGKDATFEVELKYGYLFKSVDNGEYDEETGILTLKGVARATRINFEVEYVGFDVSQEWTYEFKRGSDKDTSSISSGVDIKAGTEIKVYAGDDALNFVGWSTEKSFIDGGVIVSQDREYTFLLRENTKLYANYTEANIYYYDLNGGSFNANSYNTKINDYYTVELIGTRLKVTLLNNYFSFAESASTFFDDNTFTKEGHVLVEYNTKPDGTGTPYSLGSKFYSNGASGPVLYCIFKETVSPSLLEYVTTTIEKPEGATNADFWYTDGIKILNYLGDAEEVYLPEYINGHPVIAIAEGAFTNKSARVVSIPKTVHRVENGAFSGCSSLEALYFPNSIYEMYDEAFDEATYEGFKTLIVNGTMAPRNTKTTDGGFAVKLSRVLAAEGEKMIILISGSSSYQGAASAYIEALLDNEYTFINFGTTRPRPGLFYLEALSHYTNSEDVFIYAPENSAFMMGETILNWRFMNDLEGMNNLFRYVDISNYYGYFDAFTTLNQDTNYAKPPCRYEDIVINGWENKNGRVETDAYGDYQHYNRNDYVGVAKYVDTYYITMNNRYKSIFDGLWNDEVYQTEHKDYTNPDDVAWTSIDRPELVLHMNKIIDYAKGSGAKVYFSFAPADANELVPEAQNLEWLLAYDKLIEDLYTFDGLLGSSVDYIYATEYMYDCAFHVNNYGRAYRSYQLYLDLCEKLSIEAKDDYTACGTDFAGCLFEDGSTGTPLIHVDYLLEEGE